MKNVKRLLRNGGNKRDIFKTASEEGQDPKKVSRYLALYPDAEEAQAYNTANNILIGIYSALVFLGLLGAAPMLAGLPMLALLVVLVFSLLIPSVVIHSIYKKQSIGYLVLCFFLIKGVLDSFKGYEPGDIAVWVGAAINICLIVFVVVLKNKLFPHQNFFNTRKNDDGIVIFTKDLASR